MIPKIVHFYWGADTLPLLRFTTIWSFRKYNPDWKIILYHPLKLSKTKTWKSIEQKSSFEGGQDWSHKLDELEVEQKPITMKDFGFADNIPEVFKSDLLRWHLLAEQGGLWSDMDILYVKPISAFLKQPESDTYVCYVVHPIKSHSIGGKRGVRAGYKKKRDFYSIGFLLSGGDNKFYRHLSKIAIDHFDPKNYQSLGSILIRNQGPPISAPATVVNIPMEIVYPYDSFHIPDIFSDSVRELPPESIGVHWYGGHQLPAIFQQQLERDGQPPNCLLGELLRKENIPQIFN